MNYLKQVNTFFELLLTNPLSANAQCLYFNLLNINNRCNWSEEFTTANSTLMGFTNLNKQALYRARNELVQKKLIDFKKGINQSQSGKYKIFEFVTANDTANDTADDTPNDTPNDTADDTNNKLNKTKQNETKIKKKKEIKKETEIDKLIDENFSDEELKKTVYEFIKMRKAIKKPLTTKGLELMIGKLYKLTSNIDEQMQILNNSIMNNWQGIFPLKDNSYKSSSKGSFDDFKELWEEARIEDEQTGNNTSNNSFSW